MLGKLIKHEWKAVWKFLTIIYILMICLTIVGAFGSFFIDQFGSLSENITALLVVLYIFTYILCICAISIATTIYLGVRFYKTMYGDEGYLTHTLPATPLQLIASKAIVAVLWTWIYSILMCLCFILLFFCVFAAAGSPISMTEVMSGFRSLLEEFYYLGFSPLSIGLLYGALFIVGGISSILMIYCSAAVGQLFDKHRILSAVGIYFGLTMLMQVFSSVFGAIFSVVSIPSGNVQLAFNLILWISFLGVAIMSVVYFLVTYFLTKKKLNLE